MDWPQKEMKNKSATTTNTCCLNVTLIRSIKTVVTHFRLPRSSPNSATRRWNCCISRRHRPLLDSAGQSFQWRGKKGNPSSRARPTRTPWGGAVDALQNWAEGSGRTAQHSNSQDHIVHFKKRSFAWQHMSRLFVLVAGWGLRSHHKSIYSLEVRVKWSRDDVLRAALSPMFCSASEYNCCRVGRADGQVNWASGETLEWLPGIPVQVWEQNQRLIRSHQQLTIGCERGLGLCWKSGK